MPIAAGLVFSQFLGTLYVRYSNLTLHDQIQALAAADWFTLPCGPVVASLNTFQTAFWGGLFYTLSVGSGLTLITWALVGLGRIFFTGRRAFAWSMVIAWAALAAAVNINGFAFFASLFIVGIPAVTAITAYLAKPAQTKAHHRWLWCVPVLVLIGLTALWSTQLNKNLFVTIRDHVLLSNPVGRGVNDFYYRYTLYAAEAFKSFQQKSIRTCRLENMDDSRLRGRLEKALAGWDVLTVNASVDTDLIIRPAGDDQLQLVSGDKTMVKVETGVFFKNIGNWLQRFSRVDDRQAPFRRYIFAGVLFGFPILLYMGIYGLLRVFTGLFLNDRKATWWTAGMCLLIGILLFVPMLVGRDRALSKEQMAQALQADDASQRIVALRQMEQQGTDIGRLTGYDHLLTSDRVVERYWLARVLANSRSPASYRSLLILMRDPHPNVVCQAYFALGRIGYRSAIEPIKIQMAQSDHWYTQFYGYRAIRRLGWSQTK